MGKIAIIYGASGFIGGGLAEMLATEGFEVTGVSRKGKGHVPGVSRWVKPNDVDLRGCEVVVNLAGCPIDQRWTDAKKNEFHESRVGVTRDIVACISDIPESERPGLLLNGSAVGIYGDRFDERLDESSSRGAGYLADLCADWELAAEKAEALGVRVVKFRIGVVLGKGGLAFEKLNKVFRAGIGGRLGDGRQWMPWIHVDDLRRAMIFAVMNANIHGPVNGTAPDPERNRDFTHKFARSVGRKVFLPVPAFALRLVLGDFAGVLLAGQHAAPKKLLQAGFLFRFRKLEDALDELNS